MNAFAVADGDWNSEPSPLRLLQISSSLTSYQGAKASRYDKSGKKPCLPTSSSLFVLSTHYNYKNNIL